MILSKNVFGFCYKSTTTIWNMQLMAKVLNSSKLWPRIPNRLKNCKNLYGLEDSIKIFTISATNPNKM